jgi:hypothetical protein
MLSVSITNAQDTTVLTTVRRLADSVTTLYEKLIVSIKKSKTDPEYNKAKKSYYDYILLQYQSMDDALDEFEDSTIDGEFRSMDDIHNYIDIQRKRVAHLQKVIKRLDTGFKKAPPALKPLLVAYKKEDGLEFL